jgi:Transposase IS116/IS110/IS902 family
VKRRWRKRDELLRSAPGFGAVLSRTLLAQLPQLGINRKEIAALAGVAPFNRDSGILRGSRCIWGDRAEFQTRPLRGRRVAAIRSNPAVRNFYWQLRARSKNAKRALNRLHAQAAGLSDGERIADHYHGMPEKMFRALGSATQAQNRYRLHAEACQRILRPVGPQDASLARRLSEILSFAHLIGYAGRRLLVSAPLRST